MDRRAANDPQRDHPGEAVSKRTKVKSGPDWWASEKGCYRWCDQLGLPYIQTPSIVFEDWFMNLPLVEMRIVTVVLRLTVGWHRERTKPLPLPFLCYITKHSKPIVVKALSRLSAYGILDSYRLSRRQAFCYSLIFQRHFNELKEAPAETKQSALPFNVHNLSGKENLTTQPPSVVKKPLPLSGKENLTTQAPVLICVKERNTHKESECVSQFSREDRIRHQKAHGFNDGWLYLSEDGRYDWIIEKERNEVREATEELTIHERLRREGVI
jgi:hypothetical protein